MSKSRMRFVLIPCLLFIVLSKGLLSGEFSKSNLIKRNEIEVSFNTANEVQFLVLHAPKKQYSQEIAFNREYHIPEMISQIHKGRPIGKWLFFHKNGRVELATIANGTYNDAGGPNFCERRKFSAAGQLIDYQDDPPCKYGKGIVRFFLPPGEYEITVTPLRVRKEPSLKSTTLEILQEHPKRVEVIDYSTERLELNGYYAPWARIKTANGGEGWVYGGYLEPVNYGETYKKFFQNIDWKAFAAKMGLE